MSDNQIEIKTQLTAPSITPADIEAVIAHETYFTAGDGFAGAMSMDPEFMNQTESSRMIHPPEQLDLLTICVLLLRNGHTVVGEAHCADPAKFNEKTGRMEARKRAIDKLWPMVIYAERERLACGATTKVTDEMVGRFLTWKLPHDFAPDCHISFNKQAALASQPTTWPAGTNLLHAGQARDMLNHILGAASPTSFQDRVRAEAAELNAKLDKLTAFLKTETFGELPVTDHDLLTAQYAAMLDYSNCLADRIKAFGGAA